MRGKAQPSGQSGRKRDGHGWKVRQKVRTDCVDPCYLHRAEPAIPVGKVAGSTGDLIREGKIPDWGHSRATAKQIENAHAVALLTDIQRGFPGMERMLGKDVIPLCKKTDSGFVPFSTLAPGFPSRRIGPDRRYEKSEVGNAISAIKRKISRRQAFAGSDKPVCERQKRDACRIVLARMRQEEDFIVPIPEMRRYDRLRENPGAAGIELTAGE